MACYRCYGKMVEVTIVSLWGLGIDLEGEIEEKAEKNKARGYKHGKRL